MAFNLRSGIKAEAAGNNFFLALSDEGDLFSWGDNYYGQLGNGTYGNVDVPTKILSGIRPSPLVASTVWR